MRANESPSRRNFRSDEPRSKEPRSIPRQIADQIAQDVVRGRYAEDQRIREEDLAREYGVSRGPVREALRMLEPSGIVVIEPRRGARAAQLSLDTFADSVNLRACLLAFAVRCFARMAEPEAIEEFAKRIDDLSAMAEDAEADPIEFGRQITRARHVVERNCGSDQMKRMLREHARYSLWELIWGTRPLDYHTQERRRESAAEWQEVVEHVRAGRDWEAELKVRDSMFRSRDEVLKTLAQSSFVVPDPARAFFDR